VETNNGCRISIIRKSQRETEENDNGTSISGIDQKTADPSLQVKKEKHTNISEC
jgi:hypothetical protein